MRIVFIGCVKSSAYFLEKLISLGYSPVGVVTKESSKFNSDFVDLMPMCRENNISCLYASDVNESRVVSYINALEPDLIYCFGWSQLLGSSILDIPRIGAVGFHPAKLPNNRGRHPLIWALALGLSETASTFFMMDENADTGGIISQKTIPIAYEDDAESLYNKILQVAGEQVLSFTDAFVQGEVEVRTQQVTGNSWRKRGSEDGRIDWRMSGRAIYNLVRALTKPYPGAHFDRDGKMIKVWKAAEMPMDGMENIECGKVVSIQSPTEFSVKAYDSVIHIMSCDPVYLKEGEYLR